MYTFCHPVTFHCGWRSPSGRNKDKSTLGQTVLSLLKGYYHQSWFYDWSRAGGTGVIPAENNNAVWDEKVPVLPACCSVGDSALETLWPSATFTATARQMAPIFLSKERTPASRVYLQTRSHTNHSVITAATAGPGPCIDCFLADNHPKISNLWGN